VTFLITTGWPIERAFDNFCFPQLFTRSQPAALRLSPHQEISLQPPPTQAAALIKGGAAAQASIGAML
jgi:hypothetical protein